MDQEKLLNSICINPSVINNSKRNGEETGYVTVSLKDCLSCSGCVTEDETVFLNNDTGKQLLEILGQKQGDKSLLVIGSISPQSLASISSTYRISRLCAFRRICYFLKELGVDYVFDLGFSRDLSLMMGYSEFVNVYRKYTEEKDSMFHRHFPIISSSCPGVVYYVERRYTWLIDRLSCVKSPQQMMGSLMKHYYTDKFGVGPDKIINFVITTCNDRKLESGRSEFTDPISKSKDVDFVFTSNEFKHFMEDNKFDITKEIPDEQHRFIPDQPFSNLTDHDSDFPNPENSFSDGYMTYILKKMCSDFFKEKEYSIETKVLKGNDFVEHHLKDEHNNSVLVFASVYGLTNIQNMVKKLRNNQLDYHYIEMMTCQEGCINGNGQIHCYLNDRSEKANELLKLKSLYTDSVNSTPDENTQMHDILLKWNTVSGASEVHSALHTKYSKVENKYQNLKFKW